jgi:hypothetical protein
MSISCKRIKDQLIHLIESNSPLINYELIEQSHNAFTVHKKYNNVTIQESVLYLLKTKNSIPKILMNILNIELSDLFPDKLFNATIFNIFGCPLSTDVDVAIKVPYIMDEGFLILDFIKQQLNELGYSEKYIDFVQVVVDKSNNISFTNKGTKELQNMIYYTYHEHKQLYPPLFSNPTTYIDSFSKIASINKHVIDNVDYYCNLTRQIAKEIRTNFYQEPTKKIQFINNLLQNYTITQLDTNIKAITVKLCQAIIIINNTNLIPNMYSKINLAKVFSIKYDLPYNVLLSMLTRGLLPNNNNIILTDIQTVFNNIVNIYIDICNIDDLFDLSLIVPFNYKITNNTLFDEFIKSPFKPTDAFIDFYKTYYDNDLTKLLSKDNDTDLYALYSNFKDVHQFLDEDFIEKHVELCDQRSIEWNEKRNFYQCGHDNGINEFTGHTIDEFVQTYYNLFRGAISEILVVQFCDFNALLHFEVIPFLCGLIVESKTINSKAVAPDLLLVDKITKKIIPVEIKSIAGPPEYSSYLKKSMQLARGQVNNCKHIIGDLYYGFSLIIVLFIHNVNDNFIYDVRAIKIE